MYLGTSRIPDRRPSVAAEFCTVQKTRSLRLPTTGNLKRILRFRGCCTYQTFLHEKTKCPAEISWGRSDANTKRGGALCLLQTMGVSLPNWLITRSASTVFQPL